MQHWRRPFTRGRAARALRQDPIPGLLAGVSFRGQRIVHALGRIPDAAGLAGQIVYPGGAVLVCDYVWAVSMKKWAVLVSLIRRATSSPSISGSS